MKAVIFGAGNIGRGFIAPLFSFDGFDVTFVDVVQKTVDRINSSNEYPLNIVSNEGTKTLTVKNINAVNGNSTEDAVRAIADCDIAATCVGAKAIKYILPNFAAAVKVRCAENKKPLNLLICENLMDADKYVRELLSDMLTPEELECVGLVETSVGRMVPAPKPKADGDLSDPLEISVEEYGVLPVDKAAFNGDIINVKNIVPFSPFHYYVERKLYIHNMGHAITAYLGSTFYNDEYIYQSVDRPIVKLIAQNAMTESAMALQTKYNVPFEPLMQHVWDLLRRFSNKALGDTCHRVGNDIPRKLAASDRLVGAALNIQNEGGKPVYACLGAGAALYTYIKQNPDIESAEEALASLSGLDKNSDIAKRITEFCLLFENGGTPEDAVELADKMKKSDVGMIV